MRKIISKILLVLAIMFVCFGCSNEAGFKDYRNYLNDSMKSVTNITTNIKAYDSNVLVYEYDNQIVLLADGSAEVIKNISSLNSNFELETKKTKTVVESLDRSTLLNLNLSESLLNNIQIEEQKVTFSVSSSNVKTVFNSYELNINGDALCVFAYENNKISTITITFTTASQKNVEVNIGYLY